jgi:predicted transposase YbfD/YdcC
VTIDAMGCQRAIAEQIIDQQGDDVLGLKGNQELLHEAVQDYFQTAMDADCQRLTVPHDDHEDVDKGHGRLDSRQHWIVEDLSTLPNSDQWKGLRSIGMVRRVSMSNGDTTTDTRYFINSIAAQAKPFANAVRNHWGIENLFALVSGYDVPGR